MRKTKTKRALGQGVLLLVLSLSVAVWVYGQMAGYDWWPPLTFRHSSHRSFVSLETRDMDSLVARLSQPVLPSPAPGSWVTIVLSWSFLDEAHNIFVSGRDTSDRFEVRYDARTVGTVSRSDVTDFLRTLASLFYYGSYPVRVHRLTGAYIEACPADSGTARRRGTASITITWGRLRGEITCDIESGGIPTTGDFGRLANQLASWVQD
jgi:hypothetical protein